MSQEPAPALRRTERSDHIHFKRGFGVCGFGGIGKENRQNGVNR